jgi:parvulin-like peptidyl-prolyl isomerase
VPADLLATLEAGAAFWSIGDPLGPSASVRGASDPEIRGTYGAVFAEHIAGAPPGRWAGPLPSKAGVHFVRVLARTAAASVPFEEARARVRDDWRRVRREASVERELEGMRSRYRVVVDGAG